MGDLIPEDDYEYDEYVYQAFGFEHPIYLYVWEILVCVTIVIEILFTLTLLQKKLRGVTSYLLCAIAVSDCLTGIVTLPTYIMVYQRLQQPEHYVTDNYYTTFNQSDSYYSSGYLESIYYGEEDAFKNESASTTHHNDQQPAHDAYILDKKLCEAFMISKFFLSKTFHTISIWLTMFLGIQRCLSVWYPFTAPRWFTIKKTFVTCFVIVLLSTGLHGFHLFHDKTVEGFCAWKLSDDCSGGSCVQFWATLALRHLIPCIILSVTTGVMVKNLLRSSFKTTRTRSSRKFQRGSEVAEDEHQLVSRIVTAILIVFLLTEVPYGLFLLYISTAGRFNRNNIATNRAIHATYEITMVLSFTANFCIYTAFNKRFRSELKRLILCNCYRPRHRGQLSHTSSQSQAQYGTEMSTLMTKN